MFYMNATVVNQDIAGADETGITIAGCEFSIHNRYSISFSTDTIIPSNGTSRRGVIGNIYGRVVKTEARTTIF